MRGRAGIRYGRSGRWWAGLWLVSGLAGLAACQVAVGQPADTDLSLRAVQQAAGEDRHAEAVKLAVAYRQRTPDDRQVDYLLGRSLFCLGRAAEAVRAFDEHLTDNPSLASRQWERGIACYYAGQFEAGARQFELYQTYHANDVENSVWRFLCMVPEHGVEKARQAILPIEHDARVPMMQIYDLYRGAATVDDVLRAVKAGEPDSEARASRLFYAQLYIGLYLEAVGQTAEARKYLLAADEEHRTRTGINRYMWWVAHVHAQRLRAERPNIIFILADDLGYGDLGCYGQQRIQTPNLDRMAAEGLRFTDFYAGSTVCAPSRCTLMTGYHTGHALIRGNGKDNLRPEDVTVAELMQNAGYATGLFGKWGLGHEGSTGLPTRQGFDVFYGYLDQHHAHNYYPSYLMRNEARVPLANVVPGEGEWGQGVATVKKDYSHDLVMHEALQFVEAQRTQQKPFFMYLALTIPHANNEARDAGMEVPELGAYADLDWPAPQKAHAAMITRMDRDLGRLFETLRRLGLDERTLVMFSSDNGPHREGGNDPDFNDSNGPLRGIKRDLTEGGIRVPMLARWPGKIAAGRTTSFAGAFWDVMPTLAELADAQAGVPPDVDGLSFVPTLLDRGEQAQHPYLYWAFYEGNAGQAVRMENWKAVKQPYFSELRLYDLSKDLGEQHDRAAERPEIAERMQAAMSEAHRPAERWKFPAKPPARQRQP